MTGVRGEGSIWRTVWVFNDNGQTSRCVIPYKSLFDRFNIETVHILIIKKNNMKKMFQFQDLWGSKQRK